MKICVFGASSDLIDPSYIQAVEELGEKMSKRGHSLVFGCGATGLMGAVARGVKRGGGYIHGVVPTFFKGGSVELLYKECDKTTYTETMRERKSIMEDDADAFIVVPGGIGTFEEFFEVLTLKQLNRHEKAIVILNINGYYDDFQKFMLYSEQEKFNGDNLKKLYEVIDDADTALEYLEKYVPVSIPFRRVKLGEKEV